MTFSQDPWLACCAAILALGLAGCGGGMRTALPERNAAPAENQAVAPQAAGVVRTAAPASDRGSTGTGPPPSGGAVPNGPPVSGDGHGAAGAEVRTGIEPSADMALAASRVRLRAVANTHAADLLDHWGHRRLPSIVSSLAPATGTDDPGVRFRTLLDAARAASGAPAPSNLRSGDPVTVLGGKRGLDYGRWTGGPADRLKIGFDLSAAPPALRYDPAFRAALERAGKTWSNRVLDTYRAWTRSPGDLKGRLVGPSNSAGREVRVGTRGETSTGLVIHVTGVDLDGFGGYARSGRLPSGDRWEPRFGAVGFDNDYVAKAGEARLFGLMVHEIGHVLGAWMGKDITARYTPVPYANAVTGTWAGPHVVALHGGPAPFQDGATPYDWVDGERSSGAHSFDLAHSGVCASVMSYCRHGAAIPAFLPAEIDFAFLRDLGLSVANADDRPETYGFAGWADHSAFTISVARQFDISLADPQPRYRGSGEKWEALDTEDLLWAEAEVFGYRTAGTLGASFPLGGTVSYAGGLLGAATAYPDLPPVFGDANLSIELGSLTGIASFTSLWMSRNGGRTVFGDGSLHYPFSVTADGISRAEPGVLLSAHFYGPQHDEVAGTLDDSRAQLLASFGATIDDRPSYRAMIESADHVRGMMHQSGWKDADGWYRYRCGTGPACEGIHEWWKSGRDWYDVKASGTRSPRERVLVWTAGWGPWLTGELVADRDTVRILRRSGHEHDGRQGRHESDGYFGIMQHAAFGTTFYRYTDWVRDNGEEWDFSISGTGFQGMRSGTRPAGSAAWTGHMLGFQRGRTAGEDPFVEGSATVRVRFGADALDVEFDDVRSVDGARRIASFGFEDIPLGRDGTFQGFDSGRIEGAFFGPAHEEAAGMFVHNDNRITGSFGAARQ